MAEKLTIRADNQTGPAFDEIQKDAKKTAAEVDKINPAAKGAESSLSKMAALGAQIFALREIIQRVNQTITFLAENGNEGAQELKASFGELQGTFTDIASHPLMTKGFSALADSIRSGVIPAVEDAGAATLNWLRGMQDWMALALATTREEYETIVEMQKAEREGAEERRANAEFEATSARQTAQLTQDLMMLEHQRAVAEQAAAVQQISDLEEIDRTREATIEGLKESAKYGTLDEEGRQKGLAKLNQLEQRRQQLIKDTAAEQKRAFAEAQRAYQEEFDFELQVEKRRHQEYLKNKAAEVQAAREAAAAKIQAELEVAQAQQDIEQEKIRRAQEALGGAEGTKQAAAGLDPRAVREEFARQQTDAVRNREGFGDLSAKDQRRALKDARTTAFQNFNQGNVSQEAMSGAQSSLLSGAADQAAAQGKVSAETAQAVRQLAIGYQQEAQRAAQIEQEMRALSQQVNSITGQRGSTNQRSRAGGRGAY